MLRLILGFVVLVLLIVAASGAALYHYFGWKGLLAAPLVLIVLVWVGKVAAKQIFTRLALGLFSVKSGVLKGANVTIHSVRPVNKPEPAKNELPEENSEPDNESSSEVESDAGDEEAPEEPAEEPESPKEYFEVDMTISPKNSDGDRVWEPSEFILTSQQVSNLMKLEETDSEGNVEELLVWNGSAFGADDPGKYPGEQRLLVTFSVKPGTKKAWLQYYDVALTQVQFPEWHPPQAGTVPLAVEGT